MREKIQKDGYLEVNTPAVMPKVLWEKSGHWSDFPNSEEPLCPHVKLHNPHHCGLIIAIYTLISYFASIFFTFHKKKRDVF